jgi:hypothetical protein
MYQLIVRLSRTGLRRGTRDGSTAWLWIGIAATTVRVLRRLLAEPGAVERLELGPGEGIEIRSVRAPRA